MLRVEALCGPRQAVSGLRRRPALKRIHVDAQLYPLGPAEAPQAARLHPPLRPTLAAKVPTGDDWIHELKHDGFRIVAHDGDRVHLWSRNGRDRTGDFVAI